MWPIILPYKSCLYKLFMWYLPNYYDTLYEFNVGPETLFFCQISCRNVPYFYNTLMGPILTLVSPLTTCFLPIMVVGGLGPYHRLWPNDAPCKRIVTTPTSGGMIGAVRLVIPTPKPCLLPYYLQTMRVKDLFVSGSTRNMS